MKPNLFLQPNQFDLVASLFCIHYKSLFTSHAGPLNDDILQHVPVSVTPAMNDGLVRTFSAKEVKQALDSVGDLKAPDQSLQRHLQAHFQGPRKPAEGVVARYHFSFTECLRAGTYDY